jgi:hypothetical protein
MTQYGVHDWNLYEERDRFTRFLLLSEYEKVSSLYIWIYSYLGTVRRPLLISTYGVIHRRSVLSEYYVGALDGCGFSDKW